MACGLRSIRTCKRQLEVDGRGTVSFSRLQRKQAESKTYWYSLRKILTERDTWMRKGMRSKNLRAGVSDPQSECVEETIHLSGLTPSQTGKNDKLKIKLLKKRSTYQKYFERNLSTIDDKIRKIALARGIKEQSVYAQRATRLIRYSKVWGSKDILTELKRDQRDSGEVIHTLLREGDELKKESKKYIARVARKWDAKTIDDKIRKKKERRLALLAREDMEASRKSDALIAGWMSEGRSYQDLVSSYGPGRLPGDLYYATTWGRIYDAYHSVTPREEICFRCKPSHWISQEHTSVPGSSKASVSRSNAQRGRGKGKGRGKR